MVKICSDSDLKISVQHVTPCGGGFDFRHVVKVSNTYIAHMDLINNYNVSNVYTDIQVYNKLSF
jgi:hypothetical protein